MSHWHCRTEQLINYIMHPYSCIGSRGEKIGVAGEDEGEGKRGGEEKIGGERDKEERGGKMVCCRKV